MSAIAQTHEAAYARRNGNTNRASVNATSRGPIAHFVLANAAFVIFKSSFGFGVRRLGRLLELYADAGFLAPHHAA